MPLYTAECPNCQHRDTYYRSIDKRNDTPPCPNCCGVSMDKVIDQVHTDMREFDTPIHMESIACRDENELRDFKQKCPDIECPDDPNHPDYGVPVARSRKEKLRALKAVGYVEKN